MVAQARSLGSHWLQSSKGSPSSAPNRMLRKPEQSTNRSASSRLPVLEHDGGNVTALAITLDTIDQALDPRDAAPFGKLAQVLPVEKCVEMVGVGVAAEDAALVGSGGAKRLARPIALAGNKSSKAG